VYSNEEAKSDNEILRKFAPVLLHSIDRHPEFDLIARIDFDGDEDASNNAGHVKSIKADSVVVYSAVVGETLDSYYLFYGFYHPRDYDSYYREFLFAAAAHDSDFEGCMILISKKEDKPRALEFWSHNRFYQYSVDYVKSTVSLGKEEIDGKLFLENEQNPLLYIPDKGHGGRALYDKDLIKLDTRKGILYRPYWQKTTESNENKGPTMVKYYTLENMDIFYKHAKDTHSKLLINYVPIELDLSLNTFIAGEYSGGDNWARPKMPWAWFQTFMSAGTRIGLWYFHPAYVFKENFGYDLSLEYLHNEPSEIFRNKIDTKLLQSLTEHRESTLSRNIRSFWNILLDHTKQLLRKIIDYLFDLFG
jgi:hypothetical protein